MKRIHFFQAGTHTAMSGTELEFTDSVLSQIAANYDPNLHEAPLTIGHPSTNAPAYGWVKDVESNNEGLFADPHQVNDDFAEMVRKGAFKKVSASFYTPTAPNNPAPGEFYLRHIGFLGAQPPAVKGLKGIEFGEQEEGVEDVEVTFADAMNMSIIARLFRGLRDAMIENWGTEKTDQALPGFLVEDLEAEARNPSTEGEPAPGFSDPNEVDDMTKEEFEKQQKEFERQKAEFAETQKSFEDQQKALEADRLKLARSEMLSFCETLEKDGRLLPAFKDLAVDLAMTLPTDTEVEFSEGNGKKKASPRDAFKVFLNGLPKAVHYGENAGEDGGDPADFSDDELLTKAQEFMEAKKVKGIRVTPMEALSAVKQGKAA